MRAKLLRLLGLGLALTGWLTGGNAAPRPNLVFILADDLGWGELGCYGQEKIRTPHLDQLAAQGLRFRHHYSGAPVCAPARNVLLTGQHLGHAEIRGNKQARGTDLATEGQWPMSTNAVTLATVLRQAGYATGAVGKWGLGPVGSSGDPNRHGFDLFFGYNCQARAHSYFPAHLWRNDQRVPLNDPPIPGHHKQPDGPVRLAAYQGQTYAPELIVTEAVKFIAAHTNQPFFLYCAFIEPHLALQPPARLVESYPAQWDAKPYRGQNGYLPHPRPRAAYAALITSLDEHVGRVLQALDRHGLASNTIVIFTSDNGPTHRGQDPEFGIGGVDTDFFNSTRGLRGFKGSVFEGGLRVPLLVRWPGQIPPGRVSDVPSYFPDHFATICDALQLPRPGRLDGVSLLAAWRQAEAPERPPLVWVFTEYGGQVAVRVNHFKVLRQKLNTAKPSGWEVYDLARDPNETTNLAAQHPELIARARAILREQTDVNPQFPTPPFDAAPE